MLYFPRYMMITGITVLALAFYMPDLRTMEKPDFEKLLPDVLSRYVPVGVVGFLLAGLMAAFMSNFAATINAAPAYIVNDIYKRFINPNASAKTYVRLSRIASLGVLSVGILFGLLTQNIRDVMMWIVGALYGGYVMANVLKWIWWRFNGYGYFWGMVSGIVSAMVDSRSCAKRTGLVELGHQPALFLPDHLRHLHRRLLAGNISEQARGRGRPEKLLQNRESLGLLGSDSRESAARRSGRFSRTGTSAAMRQRCGRHRLAIVPDGFADLHRPAKLAWVGGIAALLVVTTIFIKFNWYDKLEAPSGKFNRGSH